jgi:uncharacterized protein YgiB involved in biofilm formation
VTLVMIGLAALGGCSESRQDVYASREDCLADWGNKPDDCKPSADKRHSGLGYFVGPMYAASAFRGMGFGSGASSSSGSSFRSSSSSSSSSGSRSVSRGGFGSSSRSSGS